MKNATPLLKSNNKRAQVVNKRTGKTGIMTESLKPMEEVIAVHEFRSPKVNLLDISQGDIVYVMGKNENGWWDGVVFGELGPIRGWFPSSYCKSRSQMANESQWGKPQTMTSLLRQNLDRPRKNSSVSFTSDHSALDQESIKPSRSSLDPTATEISVDRIQLVTVQEAESIFNSTGSSNVPIWIPQATTEGTIIYYNSEMNIYCKELPYIETPEVDEASVVRIPTNDQDPTLLSVVNLHKAHIDTGFIRNRQSLPNTASSVSDRKSSGKGSIVSKTSERSTTTVHPWNTSLYCVPDLFYYDAADITTWSSLRDGFLYFLQLTLDSLEKKAGPSFYSYFNIASRLGVLINLSARLAQHDLQKSGYQKRVHRRLKKIASSIAQVGINGSLYLNDDGADRNLSTSTRDTITPNKSVDSNKSVDPKISEVPSNSINYLEQVEIEVENLKKSATTCIKVFMQISSNNFNDQAYLPQVYPRFLTGFFSGGNWRNPFVPEPKDPFAGKEVVKSLHQKRLQKTILSKETYEMLEGKKQQLVEILEDVLAMLREQKNDQSRNVQILSKVHRSLTISSKIIDMFEGLDFSIFLNSRRDSLTGDFDASKMVYPLLSEFFASKQDLRDIFVTIIMESQNLTLDDATLFRSVREDKIDIQDTHIHMEPHRTARQLEAELQKLDVECDDGISIDVDKNLESAILSSFEALEVSLALVAQLISERDAYLNYATRLLNDDLVYDLIPTEREDSTMTDEYALPASATGRHQKRDIPWYLESEEFNLIFSNNDTVKGGTRDALVQRLTHHDLLDASFNMTFLTTFRSMMTTTILIEMLIKRFNIEPPENLSYEEYTDWLEKKSYPIKLRVVNIMKSLLNKYWTPAYLEPTLPSIWGSFIDELVAENFPGSEQLSRNFKKNVLNEGFDTIKKSEPEKEKSFSSKIKKMKLLDVDSTEFANQLTIKEARLYSLITHIECLDKAWNNKYGSLGGYQHLQEFIYNSNDLTNFVSTTIVKQGDIKKRVNIIKYFVDVAEKCRHLNNFSSMTAIVSALYSSPVHRLNKTWKLVPPQTMSTMNKLNDLMNSSRNFSEYREHLRFIGDHPCVPFLGVFLSDLTFTTNGNSDHLHGDSNLVNFSKRAKTLDILREMSKYQSLKYNLKVNDDIQLLIAFRLSNVQSIDEQYNHSLIIEPRVRVSKTVTHEQSRPKTKITKYSIVPFAGYGP